jgi:hypothetical protein
MKVGKKITFEEYWKDKRYSAKKAVFTSMKRSVGDNIYEPLVDNPIGCDDFKQHRSVHSTPGDQRSENMLDRFLDHENKKTKKKDLGGKYVLIADSEDFVYFGTSEAVVLPPQELQNALPVRRGHKCRFSKHILDVWEKLVGSLLQKYRGMCGMPGMFGSCICPDSAKAPNCNGPCH